MRRRDTYWSLFQKSEKRQIDDLRTDYIEVAYEVIPVRDHDDWLVWREGFRNWKPLAEFPHLLIGLREAGRLNAPSVPAPKPLPKEAPASAAAEPSPASASAKSSSPSSSQSVATKSLATKSQAATTTVQDRLNRLGSVDDEVSFGIIDENSLIDRDARYQKKWELRIISASKIVVNQTVDVSNRGMSLRDPLPKGLSRYFNVELIAGDTVIPLMCSEIKDEEAPSSKRIRIEVNHQPTLLQTALLQY